MFRNAGGITEVRDVAHIKNLFTEGVDVVVNCTGNVTDDTSKGARTLKGVEDDKVYPTRGHTVIVRAPMVGYTITTARGPSSEFSYIIPRGDGTVVLGGTYEPNKSDLHPDEAVTNRIIERCVALCPDLVGENGGVHCAFEALGE
ncbi:hypothetical protein HK097_002034 [Rhizophlyctis rosea]|uniref:FAD dependent oxidoreductase domain-containing protein n=1 Tax=Rhizophlyctis rosea TaxID=64517 RepID=A0AAD5X0Y1_9FUNG|nr:hypothetical protein HK097_002034 [Rhizophlyctis rosea]